jgi:beta-glucanase (GH16 family)
MLLTSLLFLLSCGKSPNPTPESNAPTNLVITATVSSDGTGNVDFKATATNASAFKFEFGNGVIQDVPSGIITYRYTTLGTLTYTVKVTASNSAGKTVSATKDVTVAVTNTALSLVWSDEFNNTGAPDASKWGYDIGTGSNGWGNAELQYYTNRIENAYCDNGTLKIKAIKENYSGSAYTSARMLSKTKYEFKYGRVECRAKLPAGVGTWPAIWMLGADINTVGWPACGEIDIMEHKGSDLNRIFGTLHYPGFSGGSAVGNTKVISNATTEFHNYRVDWTSSSIQIFVDDQLFHTVANTNSIPFNKDFFLLLNFAMGGNFGGTVDPAFTNAIFEVDYIRVYR